jgi:hypothetical protein
MLAMNRHKVISQRWIIAAIFVGLNALCFLGVTHGRYVHRHTRVNYSHIPAHSRGGSRDSSSAVIATVELPGHVDAVVAAQIHRVQARFVGPSAPTVVAGLPVSATYGRPDDRIVMRLGSENVLALGSAPRAPGLARAPPIA